MKDKKLIVLYILMLIVGLALLFTKSSPTPPVVEKLVEPNVVVTEPPKPKTKIVTIAVAKRDISERMIFTKDDYYFKTTEVDVESSEKYIINANEIDAYAAKQNISVDTFIQHDFIVSPSSSEYITFSIKDGSYMFPFIISQTDAYLLKNLRNGDLVDLYVLYGAETVTSRTSTEDKFVSPSRDFITNRIKPIIVGKKIIFIEPHTEDNLKSREKTVGEIQLELSNQEIKLLRTLMTNSTVMMYPSTFEENIDDGLILLSDKERTWPLSDRDIFSGTQINKLKGN